MPAYIYKTFTVTGGTYISETFLPYEGLNQGVQPDPPPWFHFLNGPVILGIQTYSGYNFTAPLTYGVYHIYFTLFTGEVWRIRIVVVQEEFDIYHNCCGDRNIAWLNIQGGWQNYIFNGIKTFQVEVGKTKQFKTNELVSKYAQIDGVFNGEVLTTGDIPKAHVDLLDGLKYSIQAYLYNDETEAWDIPILVDVDSFTKYKSKDKFFEVRLKFIYAEEILIQTQ